MAQSRTEIEGAVDQVITLPVQGMSCAACQAHVERTLRATPGVKEASVNLLSQRARVRVPGRERLEQELGCSRKRYLD